MVKIHCLTLSLLLTWANSVLPEDNVVDLVNRVIGLWASVLAIKDLSSWMVGSKRYAGFKVHKGNAPSSLWTAHNLENSVEVTERKLLKSFFFSKLLTH